jgi:hypothetical protein
MPRPPIFRSAIDKYSLRSWPLPGGYGCGLAEIHAVLPGLIGGVTSLLVTRR